MAVCGFGLTSAAGWPLARTLPSRTRQAAAKHAKAATCRDGAEGKCKPDKAIKLFESAGFSGDIPALRNLGCMYGPGPGSR